MFLRLHPANYTDTGFAVGVETRIEVDLTSERAGKQQAVGFGA